MKRIPRRLYVLLVLACSGAVPAHAKETRNIQFSTPFKHVVVIFQENRTPDNLFQGLCHLPLVTVIHAAIPRRRASTTSPLRGSSINIRPPG